MIPIDILTPILIIVRQTVHLVEKISIELYLYERPYLTLNYSGQKENKKAQHPAVFEPTTS